MTAIINFGRPVALNEMKMGHYYFAISDTGSSISIGKRTRKPKDLLNPEGLVFLNDAGKIFIDPKTYRLRSSPHMKPYNIQQYHEDRYVFFEVPAHVTATPKGYIDADLNLTE